MNTKIQQIYFNNIGLGINLDKDPDGQVQKRIQELISKYLPTAKIHLIDPSHPQLEFEDLDLFIVLGGDGTFLSAARLIHGRNIPMFGLNIGTLGFLTAAEYSDAEEAFGLLRDGRYTIEHRHMLKTRFYADEKVEEFVAMNDVVVTKGSLGRMMTYRVFVDNQYATTFRGDGVIFATPTGSTAYNLSAGGPIVYPTINAISMTAICPHTLGVRNLVVSGDSKIMVQVKGDVAGYNLSVDGQQNFNIDTFRAIEITDSGHRAHILRLDDYDYFDVLRKKIIFKAQDSLEEAIDESKTTE